MKTNKSSIIFVVAFVVLAGILSYLFVFSTPSKGEIPSYVTGDTRTMYEWAKTPDGIAVLENMPCYCGCVYEGHKHARHCFWRDDGTFDKHGITCSVCLDIAKVSKQMHEDGSNICEIRDAVDNFYAPNKHLMTPTPMPTGC